MMKAAELREKSVDELKAELIAQLEEQFKLRMQKNSGQDLPTHVFKNVRRDIARIKTLLTEKQAGN